MGICVTAALGFWPHHKEGVSDASTEAAPCWAAVGPWLSSLKLGARFQASSGG